MHGEVLDLTVPTPHNIQIICYPGKKVSRPTHVLASLQQRARPSGTPGKFNIIMSSFPYLLYFHHDSQT